MFLSRGYRSKRRFVLAVEGSAGIGKSFLANYTNEGRWISPPMADMETVSLDYWTLLGKNPVAASGLYYGKHKNKLSAGYYGFNLSQEEFNVLYGMEQMSNNKHFCKPVFMDRCAMSDWVYNTILYIDEHVKSLIEIKDESEFRELFMKEIDAYVELKNGADKLVKGLQFGGLSEKGFDYTKLKIGIVGDNVDEFERFTYHEHDHDRFKRFTSSDYGFIHEDETESKINNNGMITLCFITRDYGLMETRNDAFDQKFRDVCGSYERWAWMQYIAFKLTCEHIYKERVMCIDITGYRHGLQNFFFEVDRILNDLCSNQSPSESCVSSFSLRVQAYIVAEFLFANYKYTLNCVLHFLKFDYEKLVIQDPFSYEGETLNEKKECKLVAYFLNSCDKKLHMSTCFGKVLGIYDFFAFFKYAFKNNRSTWKLRPTLCANYIFALRIEEEVENLDSPMMFYNLKYALALAFIPAQAWQGVFPLDGRCKEVKKPVFNVIGRKTHLSHILDGELRKYNGYINIGYEDVNDQLAPRSLKDKNVLSLVYFDDDDKKWAVRTRYQRCWVEV